MHSGLLGALVLCFILCFAIGFGGVIGFIKSNNLFQKKKHSFEEPAHIDIRQTKRMDDHLKYDKDLKESVDGSNASKEFKRG